MKLLIVKCEMPVPVAYACSLELHAQTRSITTTHTKPNSALRTGVKLCFWKADIASVADSLATRSRSELGAKFSAETAA